MTTLMLFGQLARLETRANAARALAAALGADDLVLFVRDPELGTLLPASGFAQTLRRGGEWRAFLATTLAQGEHSGQLPDPHGSSVLPARGYRLDGGSVLVLFGGNPDQAEVAALLPVFPLVAAMAAGDGLTRASLAKAELAIKAVAQGDVLARALERSRDQLREALKLAREARGKIDQQAAALAVSAEELERSSAELEAINEELNEANGALKAATRFAERARDVAEEANRTKAGFLAMMSHELRTPLNAIGGYSSLLEVGIMGPLAPGQLEYVSRIKRSQAHLSALVNDVLNFAKLESGTTAYHVVPLEMAGVLATIAPLIEPMAMSRGVAYEYQAPKGEVIMLGDRDKAVQVVLNLLTNAVKFTPAGGKVLLSTSATDDCALVIVSDTGPGIPPEQQASIFEPFVQLERSFTPEREGVGLGLSISRELARGMGGDITVTSTPGQGSVFTFSLPREPSAAHESATTPAANRDAKTMV